MNRWMIVVLFVVFMPGNAFSQDAMTPWTQQAQVGSVEFGLDFCNVCDCCEQPPEFLENTQENLPNTRIRVFNIDAYESLTSIQENLGFNSQSALEPLVNGAALKGLVDFCSKCNCCTQNFEVLKVAPREKWGWDSGMYRQFKFVAE